MITIECENSNVAEMHKHLQTFKKKSDHVYYIDINLTPHPRLSDHHIFKVRIESKIGDVDISTMGYYYIGMHMAELIIRQKG